jgi:hypothetical protein
VFEGNEVQSRICRPKRGEACLTEAWEKRHNAELHNSYSSPYIGVIKSRIIRTEHGACRENMRNVYI